MTVAGIQHLERVQLQLSIHIGSLMIFSDTRELTPFVQWEWSRHHSEVFAWIAPINNTFLTADQIAFNKSNNTTRDVLFH